MSEERLQFAQATVKRAERWFERIRPRVVDATVRLSDEERQEITDFVAAATGEIAAIIYQGRSALEIAFEEAGCSSDEARERAQGFSKNHVQSDYLLSGLFAVRALNVHIAPQESGRILIVSLGSSANSRSDYWTHPAIPDELAQRLDSATRMQETKRNKFNADVRNSELMDVLERGVQAAVAYLGEIEKEIKRI